MSGGIRNVLVHDCTFISTNLGIQIKSNSTRGGFVEHIWFRNIKMKDIREKAILFQMDYPAWIIGKEAYPNVRDIEISNITCEGVAVAANVTGLAEQPFERLKLKSVFIRAQKGMTFNWVKDLTLNNVKSEPISGDPILLLNCKNVNYES